MPGTRTRRTRRSLVATFVTLFLVAGVAWGYWSAGSVPGGNGAAAATSVNQGATPTATAAGGAGTVLVTWAARTLATGQAVTGYQVNRYPTGSSTAQTMLSACTGTIAGLTCTESSVPSGSWQYTVTPVFATNWRGVESAKSSSVTTDSTGPTNAITLSDAVGGSYKALGSDTVYYKGNATGSFTLTNTLVDANSGPASSQTAALGGTSTGWTHTPSTVSTPAGGPYVSNSFSWADPTTSAPTEVVTGTDVAGNQTATPLTFTNDSGSPTLGTISYTDGYTTGLSITLTFTSGTDSGSGVNASAARIKRTVAPLVNGVCQAGSVTNNGYLVAPTSPYVDTNVAAGNCYTYQYVTTDNVGNLSFASSASVAKVNYSGAVNNDAALLAYWRFGEAPIVSSDAFADTTNTLLSAHTASSGTTWTSATGTSTTAQISGGGAVRRTGVGVSVYYTAAQPASADYLVEADLVYKSAITDDFAGVVGRLNTASTGGGTFYTARYDVALAQWSLAVAANGTLTPLGTYPQVLSAGTYRVGLEMVGTTIKVLVNGTERITVTDGTLTAAGRAGVRVNNTNATPPAPTDTTGMHLDNLDVSYPADEAWVNDGDYHRGVSLGATGAIAGDSNAAATFDGANDSMQVPVPTSFPVGAASRTVETWFKTSGVGSGMVRQALFSYGTNGIGQEFGAWLESDGIRIKADGGGAADRTFTFATNFNNNQWHHFVETYDGTTVRMYVDGVAGTGGGAAVTLNTVMNTSYGFTAAAVPDSTRAGLSTQSYFNGSLDEMAFYTSTMSAATALAHYQLGTSPATADATGPTGGSVDAVGLVGTGSRYSTSTTLTIGFTPGTDPSGLRATGRTLTRASATLTSGVCGTFGGYTLVTGGADPVSPKTDSVADQACYRYRYAVEDFYGNATTYTSGDIKVDTTAPTAPTLGFSALTNAYATGGTVYYRPGAGSGGFTVTASSTDASSGIGSYAFPALGTGWTSTAGALGTNTYSWAAPNPAAPGSPSVTAASLSGATSTATSLPVVADSTAPSAGTVSYADGSTAGTTVSVAFTTGTDAGSGIGTRLLQRASTPRTSGTCGTTYTGFATVTNGTNPTSPFTDTVAPGFCYKYQYVVNDNVSNLHTATSTNVAYAPAGAYWAYNAGTGTTAVDSSGNGYTGTLGASASWTTGKVGPYALNVTGVAASSMTTSGPVIDTSESYTVASWVRLSSLTGSQNITTVEGTNVSAFFLKKDSAGVFAFTQHSSDATNATFAQVNGLTPVAGTWYHVVGVYNKQAATIQLFVNGTSQGSTASLGAWKAQGSTVVGRGRFSAASSDFTTGAIDEVRYYDRVLTQTEITALANPDVTAPTGGSVTPTGLVGTGARYSTSTTVNLTLAIGTDPSGIASSGNELRRATATLTSGTCGAYGAYSTLVATDPGTSVSDTVAAGACYSYRYTVSDTGGNAAAYLSGDVKVETTAPAAPTLAHSAFSNTFWSGSGTTVYYRSAAASGSFTTTATGTDAESGIASYAFPALGANWASTAGSAGVNTYSWSGAPAAPGTKNVTATNNAALTSAGSPFTLTADDTAPSAGTVTYTGGSQTSTTVSVAYTTGTDGGSGIGTRLLQRATAPLTGTTCGTYTTFATITGGTNPGASPVVDTVTAGSCYMYQYLVRDQVSNQDIATSTSEVKVTLSYTDTLNGTAGLLNWFRLGEVPASNDSFTDAATTVLSGHTPDLGTSWTRWVNDTITGVITNANTLRKSNVAGAVGYYTGVAPASPDYLVEADVVVKSTSLSNTVGVVGRWRTTQVGGAGTNYIARYNTDTAAWELVKSLNGTGTLLGTYPQTLTAGTTYRIGLDMNGTTIRLLVDTVQRVSVTDTDVTAAGRAGVRLGLSTDNAAQSDTTGIHLDNFYVTPPVTDSKGTNNGDFLFGVLLGVAGAIVGDVSTAVTFDGVNDYASVTRTIQDDFSIELWFKSTQGIGTGTNWWNGAGLVDAELNGALNDFGVSLRSDGRVVAGVGTPDASVVSAAGGYNNGGWHHVVFTRTKASGALQLYVDGVSAGTATGSTLSLTSPASINFGRLLNGTNYYSGSLDEVALYSTALSQATVTAHYNAGQ